MIHRNCSSSHSIHPALTGLFLVCIALVYCSASSYANDRASGHGSAVLSALSGASHTTSLDYLTPEDPLDETPIFHPDQTPRARTSQEELAAFAYKLSYAGVLLLTADQLWRSVDSVMESLRYRGLSGTEMQLRMQPSTGGFRVTLHLRRSF